MKSGIQKVVRGTNSDELVVVCICPIVITKRLENFDDETEKIELRFFRDGHWKKLIAPRSSVFNRTSIIKYADSGLPVSSKNAADIVAYLSDYENANLNVIPLVKSISRVGWRDSTTVKVHPNGTGALKKVASSQSEDLEEDLPRKFIWLPHLTERLSIFHSPEENRTIRRKV